MGAAPQANRDSYFAQLNGKQPTSAFVVSRGHANVRQMKAATPTGNTASLGRMQMSVDPLSFLRLEGKIQEYESNHPKTTQPFGGKKPINQMQYESGMGSIFADGNEQMSGVQKAGIGMMAVYPFVLASGIMANTASFDPALAPINEQPAILRTVQTREAPVLKN